MANCSSSASMSGKPPLQVHGARKTSAIPRMEDVSSKSRGRHRVDGFVRGPHDLVPAVVWISGPAALPPPSERAWRCAWSPVTRRARSRSCPRRGRRGRAPRYASCSRQRNSETIRTGPGCGMRLQSRHNRALLNVLLAFSCGAVFGAWIAGHVPDLWTVVLPACILLVFFALLTASRPHRKQRPPPRRPRPGRSGPFAANASSFALGVAVATREPAAAAPPGAKRSPGQGTDRGEAPNKELGSS